MQSGQPQDLDHEGIQEFRIERGAQVLGPDGSLGTVQLIVVDQATGALQGLVVRGEAGMEMELPAEYLESATGDRVYLSIGKADLAAHPELAQAYRPELYQPVDEGVTVPPGQVLNIDTEGPVLTEMETDAVEIAAPPSHEAQIDELKANAGFPDIADEPTVVLQPAAGMEKGAARPDILEDAQAPEQPPAPGAESAQAGTTLTGTAAMEGAAAEAVPRKAAPVDAATTEAAPLEAAPTEASPIESAPAETGSLLEAASESLFPGTLPLTPADQAVANEARADEATASTGQPPTAESATPPSAVSERSTLPAANPRTVPVLRPEQAGATPEAIRGVESNAPAERSQSGSQPGGDQRYTDRSSESSAARRRMVAAGILVGSGVAAAAYLIWRWRQTSHTPSAIRNARSRVQGARSSGGKLAAARRSRLLSGLRLDLPVSLPDVRTRLQDASAAGGKLAEALRRGLPTSLPGNVPVSLPDVRPRLEAAVRAGAQLGRTIPDVMASVDAVRNRGLNRARTLTRATNWASIWSTARVGLADLGSMLRVRASDLRMGEAVDRLRDRASQVAQVARSVRKQSAESTDTARQAMKGRAAELASKAAPGPARRRALRPARRRARWFRRGLIAGLAWGLLYAPEAGDDARDRLVSGWQRMQGMLGVAQTQPQPRPSDATRTATATGMGTGPRPRNPAPEETAPIGTQISTPMLQPRSEEPLIPPPLPEAASDEVPGAQAPI